MKQLYHIKANSTSFFSGTKGLILYQVGGKVMDKRKEANLRVKESITTTLFQLMHEKSISDISISELIRRAGVARVSFYRNYESKEDVLVTLIEDVLEQYRDTIDSNETSFYTYQNVSRSFEFFKMYGEFVLDLYQFGYGSVLLEKLNRFHEEVAGTMPNRSIEKYRLYMYMGALFNTAIMWLQNGTREELGDIAGMFCSMYDIPCPA